MRVKQKFSDPLNFSGFFSDPLNFSKKNSDPLKNAPSGYLAEKMTGPLGIITYFIFYIKSQNAEQINFLIISS